MTEGFQVSWWCRPGGRGLRGRYAVIIERPAGRPGVVAYGDREDALSPRISAYRVDGRATQKAREHLRGLGYASTPAPPVPWLDPGSEAGERNLQRIARAGHQSSVVLESRFTHSWASLDKAESTRARLADAVRDFGDIIGVIEIGTIRATDIGDEELATVWRRIEELYGALRPDLIAASRILTAARKASRAQS